MLFAKVERRSFLEQVEFRALPALLPTSEWSVVGPTMGKFIAKGSGSGFHVKNETLSFLGVATKLGFNAKGLQVVKGSQVEIRDVLCFLESLAISSSLLHVNLYLVRNHNCFVPLCCWRACCVSSVLPNACVRFCRPSCRSHNVCWDLPRASASGSSTDPCQKLLLAVFQLAAFIVECLADL